MYYDCRYSYIFMGRYKLTYYSIIGRVKILDLFNLEVADNLSLLTLLLMDVCDADLKESLSGCPSIIFFCGV